MDRTKRAVGPCRAGGYGWTVEEADEIGTTVRVRSTLIAALSIAALALPLTPAVGQEAGFVTVQPEADYVNGNQWTPGGQVTITVRDGGGSVKTSVTTSVDDGGFFDLALDVDVVGGDEVTVSGGGVSTSHAVANLSLTSVDFEADTLAGTGPASRDIRLTLWQTDDDGSDIEVYVRDITPPGSGRWAVDTTSERDLTRLDSMELLWQDDHGNLTVVYGDNQRPNIDVSIDDDAIWGGNWIPGSTVTITIDRDDDPDNGVALRLDDTLVGEDTGFGENLELDLQPGMHVTVDDGDISKHVRLPALSATVDRETDVVTGTTDATGQISVYMNEGTEQDPVAEQWVQPDADGAWRADFGTGESTHDITARTSIDIGQWDGNEDRSHVRISSLVDVEGSGTLGFEVAVRADRVRGQQWEPSTTIRVIVDDDDDSTNGTLQEVAATTNDRGEFDTDLQFDVRPGHVVTVTDGETTRSHEVRDLALTAVDRDADTATGTAAPDSYVQVQASNQETGEGAGRLVRTDASGAWTADFTNRLDLTTATDVTAFQYDDDGDWTSVTIPAPNPVLSGASRDETAAAVSQATYDEGQAEAVVLARRDDFADALAGTPFAVAMHAPLLLTGRDALPGATSDELQRVLEGGRTVYVLGGTAVIADAVVTEVQQLGYQVERISGANRFATAVAIASRVPDAQAVLLTTAWNFPDGLAAGAAAPQVNGVVLLTSGDQPDPLTASWLSDHPDLDRYAIGGPASRAHPDATAIRGANREGTALAVAAQFFDAPRVVGISRHDDFPDALAGGVHVGWAGGPMLLTSPSSLHPDVQSYLEANADTIDTAFAYGGSSALSRDVLDAILEAID